MSGAVSWLLGRFKVPVWIVLMILAAVLFLAESASFGLSGAHQMAQVGVLGAIAAVAVLVAFFPVIRRPLGVACNRAGWGRDGADRLGSAAGAASPCWRLRACPGL